MIQFRRGDRPRQKRYPLNARTTGTPNQAAVRIDTIRLTMKKISRPGALAMQTRTTADQPLEASILVEAMLLATSGESDRTSFITRLAPQLDGRFSRHGGKSKCKSGKRSNKPFQRAHVRPFISTHTIPQSYLHVSESIATNSSFRPKRWRSATA
jgi:hypothetical protein